MDTLLQTLSALLEKQPNKIILSSPRQQDQRRAEFVLAGSAYRMEHLKGTQAFHRQFSAAEMPATLLEMMQAYFFQLHAFTEEREYRLKLSKKGKLLESNSPLQKNPSPQRKNSNGTGQDTHNRPKQYLLPEGEIVPALVDMGVFTPDGRVVQKMQDKYRQINRFVELVDDCLKEENTKELRIIDFGCGKSYLTFLLYDYLTRKRGFTLHMVGLDLKADVVANCNAAAQKYGYTGLSFKTGDIADYHHEGGVDMVICLHACDTATDEALARAILWQARTILAVPCCQHELNGQMQSEELRLLTRYGIIQERAAALMTDAIRANLLSACGYKSQVLEFIDLAHTPKNRLLRATRTGQPAKVRKQALDEVNRLCDAFSLQPKLLNLLAEHRLLPT